MLQVGDSIGRYRIQHLLSSAPGRTTLLVDDPEADRQSVLTLFVVDLESGAREHIGRAVRAAMALSHPHLAAVYDVGDYASQPYVVSEHVEGTPLTSVGRPGAPRPSTNPVQRIIELCDAVAYAHAHGVTHGAITPRSVVIDAHGVLKVLDVGLVAILDLLDGDALDAMGGHGCRPPEQIARGGIDARTDVFAIGALAGELLTGVAPFGDGSPREIVERILHQQPPALASMDEGLAAIIRRALQTRPEDRYASVLEFREAVASWAHRHPWRGPADDSVQGDVAEAAHWDDTSATRVGTRPARRRSPATGALATTGARVEPPAADAYTPPEPIILDDNVQFTVFRPRAITPVRWHTMLVFAHLSERRPDAPPGEPDPVEELQRQAESVLGDLDTHGRQTVDSLEAIPQEGELTLVPRADGIEFNPPRRSFRWIESVHREEFRLRAVPRASGVVRGRLSIFLGAIIVADVPLVLRIDARAADEPPVHEATRPYRKIFASYSHRDRQIVEEFAQYARAVGDRYLRDVMDLRAGERWQPALERLIREADVFQLFWSWNTLASDYVRHEWQYALRLRRAAFVRPVYWDDPLPAHGDLPPDALRSLHFERIHPRRMPAEPTRRAVFVPADTLMSTPAARPERGPVAPVPAPLPVPMPVPTGSVPPYRRVLRPWQALGAVAAVLFLMVTLPLTLYRANGSGSLPTPVDEVPGTIARATVTIHVRTPDGLPASGASIELVRGEDDPGGEGRVVATGLTDVSGAMEFAVPMSTYRMRVSSEAGSSVEREIVVERDLTLEVTLTGR